jgi:regulatory protein
MRQWGIDDEVQARIMARLVGERYVYDNRYAEAFVRDKVRYNQWGRRKVEQALLMKHIDSDIAREALDSIDDEEYISMLKPMLKQKSRSIKANNDYERNMKLMKWALGRGFTMDIIRQCIKVEDD